MATKEQYASWCVQLVEGDDVLDELYAALQEDGFTDEGGFVQQRQANYWIYPEED